MSTMRLSIQQLAAVLILTTAPSSRAAEIQRRSECRPSGTLVLLADVAQVLEQDAKVAAKLETIELFPAPPLAAQRYLRMREIQDILERHGVSLADHVFTGSSVVTIQRPTSAPAA